MGNEELILQGGWPLPNIVPDRFFTHVEIDPVDTNEIYLTLSGYGPDGHVFRSYDGGSTWASIPDIPNSPTNDLVIHYTGPTSKEIIVAQDVGVWHTDAQNIQWQAMATQLPNSPIVKLDHNRLSGTLNCSAFGRGIWQYDMAGPIYVQDVLYITDYVILNKQIVVGPGGKLILGHSAMNTPFTITFANNSNILVLDGGNIETGGSGEVTLTSSGSWSGIEVQGQSSGCNLYNCTFTNTTTPLVINGGKLDGSGPNIILDACHITNGTVQVMSRSNVTLRYNYWTMNNSNITDAIDGIGATNLYLLYNNINYSSPVTGSHAIELSYCTDATVTRSTIANAQYPITASNAATYVRFSEITTNDASTANIGISMNGVSNGHLIYNNVYGYQTAFRLDNQSSPTMLWNTAAGMNTYTDKTVLYCYNESSPRLHPSVDEFNQIIWDAGENTLINRGAGSKGIYVSSNSEPSLDYGYNTIFGAAFNIQGTDYP